MPGLLAKDWSECWKLKMPAAALLMAPGSETGSWAMGQGQKKQRHQDSRSYSALRAQTEGQCWSKAQSLLRAKVACRRQCLYESILFANIRKLVYFSSKTTFMVYFFTNYIAPQAITFFFSLNSFI